MEELINFLNNIDFFIEVEGKRIRLEAFLHEYNEVHNENLFLNDDGLQQPEGIILLDNNANKWSLEYRLYVYECTETILNRFNFRSNRHYRKEYHYRMNNNNIIRSLLVNFGYRIGRNER